MHRKGSHFCLHKFPCINSWWIWDHRSLTRASALDIVAPFAHSSACREQRNTLPKPWEIQGEGSSLLLWMRVWTSGYTSQTSCSPGQTWIMDTETPWPHQISIASLEGCRFPLPLQGLCVSSLAHLQMVFIAMDACITLSLHMISLTNLSVVVEPDSPASIHPSSKPLPSTDAPRARKEASIVCISPIRKTRWRSNIMTILWFSPITTAVIFCACISTVSIMLYSCTGGARRGIMEMVVSWWVEDNTWELYGADVGILTCSNRDLMIELPTDHAKSFCSAFLVTSLDGVVSNV